MPDPTSLPIDWEGFYRSYRKPGYVPGFEILHKIGGGAFGLVFKARKESIAKDYAIKFLKVDDEGVRDAILTEISSVRFFAQVDHPNLVSIEDRGEVDGIPYIVMGFAGEGTLRERLETGMLERPEALRLFQQIARGVQALHEHSLVHFDLKPSNVFLKGDLVRVGDYGLSRLVTQSRNSLTFGRGTPYYMAPEVLRRRGDQRSDIYSLGVMLYECLLGDVPFRGESEWEVLRKHESEVPVLPPTLDERERSVLQRCLAKDPDARFQSVTALLEALCAPRRVAPPPPPPPPPPPRVRDIGAARRTTAPRPAEIPRRRSGRLVAPALAVLILVGMIGMLFSVRSAPRHNRAAWSRSAPQAAVTVQTESRRSRARASTAQRSTRSEWEQGLRKLTSSQLNKVAQAVERAEVPAWLREALRDASHDLQREIRHMDTPAIERALDQLGTIIDKLLEGLESEFGDSCSRTR